MPNLTVKRQLVYIQIAILAAAVVMAVSLLGFGPLVRAEKDVLSFFYKIRGGAEPSGKIVIAAIDDASIARIGSWPWKRKVFYNILDKLRGAGAATIAIDTTFAEDVIGDDRHFLIKVEDKRDTVIGYSFFQDREDIPLDKRKWATGEDVFDILTAQMLAFTGMPSAELPSMAGIKSIPTGLRLMSGTLGFTNLFPPKENSILSVPLVLRYRNLILPSLGLSVAGRYDKFTPLLRKNAYGRISGIAIGKRQVPIAPSGMMMLDLVGPAGTYERVSIADILEGEFVEEALKGKIVLVGPTFHGPNNFVATPFGNEIPIVEVWANAVDNVLFGKPLTDVISSKPTTVGVALLLALMLGFVLPRMRIPLSFLVALGFALAVILDGYLFFSQTGLWFAIATPLACIASVFFFLTIYRFFTEERLRRRMQVQYGGKLPAKVIEELIVSPLALPKRGEKRHLTVMTLGIRNFTHLLEEIKQDRLVEFMSTYLREVSSHLASEDAFINRLGNDAILAVFGAPALRMDHANRACKAALAIRRAISKKRGSWKEHFRVSSIRVSIGIHTGPVVISEMKLKGRHEFSASGLPIQLSEAFCELNRVYRTSAIVGAETVQSSREWYTFRPLELIRLRDAKRSVEIYELLGKKGVVTPYIEQYLRVYDAYRARKFEDALNLAQELLKKLPHDGPTQMISMRSQRLIDKPPPQKWDGSWLVQ